MPGRALLAVLAVVCIAAALYSFGDDHGVERTIPVAPDGTLRIELDRGEVEVRAHARDQVRIEAQARGVQAPSFHFDLRYDERDVELEGTLSFWRVRLFEDLAVTVRAWVPETYAVELETRRADVVVRDVRGDLEIENARGAVEVHGAGGRVRVGTSRAPIFASFAGAPRGELETSRAPVEVAIPDGAGLDLEAEVSRGRVDIAEGIDVAERDGDRERFAARLNGGGRLLRVETSREAIRLRER